MMATHGSDVSRRRFLFDGAVLAGSGGALATVLRDAPQNAQATPQSQQSDQPPTQEERVSGDGAQPEVTAETLAEAQKVLGLKFDEDELKLIAQTIQRQVQNYPRLRDRDLPNALAPATTFDPRLPGRAYPQLDGTIELSNSSAPPLPHSDEDIAFAPVTHLSHWIRTRQLTSKRLTDIYLERIRRYAPALECIVTVTEDLAKRQAEQADREIAAGNYRGPLHGIPYGAKDLFDTRDILTTWGATPYKERTAENDAHVIQKLEDAGAVLIAKTTLGALAYGDIWFGGRANNPWNLKEGSSGSSAGSAAGTAAGLFGFSLGTETYGSIVSPSMRCGTTGLRPTFGRVARSGAMALCWSLDKIGPICRTVEDTILVLDAINGSDPGDPSSYDYPLEYRADRPVGDLRVGYDPAWFEGRGAIDLDRNVLEIVNELGVTLVEVEIPQGPYSGMLLPILNVEAAAAFEQLTMSNMDDLLVWQEPQAWPNSFRQSWFTSAVDLVQGDRFRRQTCEMMADVFEDVDVLISPSFAGSLLLITNFTGHPCLVMRSGFRSNNRPHGFTLLGQLFDEGTLCRLGHALEQKLGVWDMRPDLAKNIREMQDVE